MIHFRVDGAPVPKQSFRYGGHSGYQPRRITDWQQTVAWAAKAAMIGKDMLTGPLAVTLEFTLPTRRRVDCDNLSKAALDAMNDVVYLDDCQVCDLHVIKRVGDDAGVTVTVAELTTQAGCGMM